MSSYSPQQIEAGFGSSVHIENDMAIQDDPAIRRMADWVEAMGMDGYHYHMPLDIWPTSHHRIWQAEWIDECMNLSYVNLGYVVLDTVTRGTPFLHHVETFAEAMTYFRELDASIIRDR